MSSNNKTSHKKTANTWQPKYRLLADQLRGRIQSRELVTGDRLPSFTEMRSRFGITSTTIERAYGLLEQEGLIERRSGSGVYVAPRENSQTGNIGLVLRLLYRKPRHKTPYTQALYTQALLAGIREGSAARHKKIVLYEEDAEIDFGEIDGILLFSDKLEAYAMRIPPEIPQVILMQHAEGILAITADDFGGAKLATSYLIRHGHRRIACLMEGSTDIPIQRRAGYLKALQEAGITPEASWTKLTEGMMFEKDRNYLAWGRRHMREWLQEGWHNSGCTAIVVQNDHSAIGVIQVLQEVGISVPGQVSVIGFDGTEDCDLVRPRLTSIEVPLYQIGQEAIKVLCEQIQYGPQTPREISFPVKLREGDSVATLSHK